ncbi:MAG: hypothetical protein K1X72_06510 [Pyrinomonadaceae bacterium]|nr:hypothetical protein [Pyrinomonadaceae bacterium]
MKSDGFSKRNAEYTAHVVELIRKTKSLANQTPLEYEEIFVQACDWQDVLEELIPVERLTEAFKKAFKLHETSYPITALDIKHGYQQILIEENAQRVEEARQEKEQNRILFCISRKNHINDEGKTKTRNPFNHNEDITMPCPFCRPKDYDREWKLLYAKYHKKTSLKIVSRTENK